MQIEISDKEIENAEKILLPKNMVFDKERRDFIKDLSTLDLQAVPGSGKTTALLAKLLILEHKLPFENNSGILVISHTNAAVDEIKNRIGIVAPKLFTYPNFVGTVQSFVDNFLAIPYYTSEYNHRPYRIDDEILYERCETAASSYSPFFNWLKKHNSPSQFLFSLNLTSERKLDEVEGLKDKTKPTFKGLEDFRKTAFADGLLKYSEAIALAAESLTKYPLVKTLLQKRFRFVFIDEMQDIEKEQYNLLEQIFYEENKENCCFQRIGDINQSIYSQNSDNDDNIWIFRAKKLQICGSHRLNPHIASIVQRFGIDNQKIDGRRKDSDGSEINIKPYIIVYETASIKSVIPKYIEIIQNLKNNHFLQDIKNERYVVAGWRKQINNKTAGKYCISDYWQDFTIEDIKTKIDYKTLDTYLNNYDRTSLTLESIRKNILNALLKILRFEKVRDDNNHYYTKRTMIDFIRNSGEDTYEKFKSTLFVWCKRIINKDKSVIFDIRNYIPKFLNLFSVKYEKSKNFVETNNQPSNTFESETKSNIYEDKNIKVSVQTVHSMKGQTCTGLLYLETFKAKGNGNKKYESQKLASYICGNSICDFPSENSFIKSAAKMVYVGFSRPTHLLCFAVQKERFDQNLSAVNKNEWEIVNI
ncbi:MAG: ATP-dependent helicase [Treponema sp.]|nr:ATP-dependent helicase [Treponema sp.]